MNNYTETYDFLVTIISNMPYGIIALDLDGEVTMCNELALSNLEINEKVNQIIENELLDYLKDIPDLRQKLIACLHKGRKPFDLDALHFNDKYLNIKGRKTLNGMMLFIEDITKAKEMEVANLTAMLEGQESEKRRLAKELHDGIGPLMGTVKLNLDGVKSDLQNKLPQATKKIAAMEELIQTVANDLRSISHALMPSALIDFGLATALQNLCMKANDSGKVVVDFYYSGTKNRLETTTELGLYRIAQELLNNAFKYAKAQTITVQLIQHKESIMLTVEDDGIGFAPKKLKELVDKGIGLQNINTRVQALGGTIDIETQLGQGLMATIEIPM